MEDKNNTYSERAAEEGNFYGGFPIHSQVMRIKQEFNKIRHPSLEQTEISRVFCKITRQRSRSPLGFSDRDRPISVGN